MIAMIQGMLEGFDDGAALIRPAGGLTYRVHMSAFTAARLGGSIGQEVTLQTFHYLESQNQGSSFTPRLAGFISVEDRRFFELFTTVKGIGNRKALRAMALDTARIAAAIADRDLATLQSLPEIGKRTAETILATLSGKVDGFVTAAAFAGGNGAASGDASRPGYGGPGGAGGMSRQALDVLLQLGEQRTQAVQWIDEAMRGDERPGSVEELIAAVYAIKNGA